MHMHFSWPTGPSHDLHPDEKVRLRAGLLALVVGVILLGVKFFAYTLTGSAAILSDAMESIVNVIAAVFALGSILYAGQPADEDHPYGHGKIEFFTAAFEGGLIAFAAMVIIWEGVRAFFHGAELQSLDTGLALVFGAGVINALMGVHLIRTGKKTHSLILVADGKHLLSDFWTSVGVVIGLGLVRLTGLTWFDPLAAVIVGLLLAWTGLGLVRHAAGGLLDAQDPELLQAILDAFNHRKKEAPGIIHIHHLRAIRMGRFSHVDAHLVLPEFWSIDEAHDVVDAFERQVIEECSIEGEIVFHSDPCRKHYCKTCALAQCPIRAEPFDSHESIALGEALKTDAELPPIPRS